MIRSRIFALLGWIVLCEAAGAIGAFFTVSAIPVWYAALAKPVFAPPSWLFGPVWTTLYLLMGVAAWLVWRNKRTAPLLRRRALRLFFIQLVLNAVWSPVFFGLHSLSGALALIVLLWLAIAVTIAAFARVSRAGAWLLAPYLAWVTFATYLAYALWSLNA